MINNSQLKASPLAKRFALFVGVDIRNVIGTGFNGKITKADVLNYIEKAEAKNSIKKNTRDEYSIATISSAIDISVALSYSARINLRFPQMNASVAAIAAKAFIASVTDKLNSSIDRFQVIDLREERAFVIPNDGKSVKVSEITGLYCVDFDPDFEIGEASTAYLLISNLTKSGESEEDSAFFTLAFPVSKGQESQIASLMKSIIRHVNDPVMLMI